MKSNLNKLSSLVLGTLLWCSGVTHAQKKDLPPSDTVITTSLCDASFYYSKSRITCPPDAVCLVADHTSVSFKASVADYQDYFWDFGDGTTGKGNPIEHSYLHDGTYKVTLKIYSPSMPSGKGDISLPVVCSSSTTQVIETGIKDSTVNYPDTTAIPKCKSGFSYTEGIDNEFKFVNQSIADKHDSYWYFGDGTSSNGDIVTHTFQTAGKYEVSHTIVSYDDKGTAVCKDLSSQIVYVSDYKDTVIVIDTIVDPMPVYYCQASIQVPQQGLTITPFDSYSLVKPFVYDGTQSYYFWQFGDGTGEVSTNPTHTYKADGKYEITLTKLTIKVALGAADSMNYACDGIIKEGDLITMAPCFYEVVCKEVYTTWVYVSEKDSIIKYPYPIDDVDNAPCNSSFVANPVDSNTVSFWNGIMTLVAIPYSATNKYYYYFSFGDGSDTTINYLGGTHTYKPGKYLVTLFTKTFEDPTVLDSNSVVCAAEVYDKDVHAFIPCYYKEICQGSTELWITVDADGLVTPSKHRSTVIASVYPNPMDKDGSITIENAQGEVEFNVYNTAGRLVLNMNGLFNGKADFSSAELPTGLYLYTVTSNGKVIKKDKFSVNR